MYFDTFIMFVDSYLAHSCEHNRCYNPKSGWTPRQHKLTWSSTPSISGSEASCQMYLVVIIRINIGIRHSLLELLNLWVRFTWLVKSYFCNDKKSVSVETWCSPAIYLNHYPAKLVDNCIMVFIMAHSVIIIICYTLLFFFSWWMCPLYHR